ncbi:MAG TPA: hypothetical protein VNU95_07295 [Candidatus Acidoferrales bacterium]|jgi:hypothetical protein|nr:hypothetical protein [Candidatus Acidoferrales bacterium]
MKNGFVEGGLTSLQRGQKELSMKAIEKKYAKEIAAAEPHEKEKIYQRMAEELARQKSHKPSFGTLW